MKYVGAVSALLAIVVMPVLAQDVKDMTLKGKLVKTEKEGKVSYTLQTNDGEVAVPAPAAKEGAEVVKLDDFVGAEVEIAAKGMEETKGGIKTITIKEVVSVKKVEKTQ